MEDDSLVLSLSLAWLKGTASLLLDLIGVIVRGTSKLYVFAGDGETYDMTL